jgi:5'-3' exonuclease
MQLYVDGNAMGHAHHNATKLSFGAMQTQAIFGFTRMMRDLRVSNPGEPIFVLWDGYAKHRFEVLPTYKGDREEALKDPEKLAHREAYRAQVPIIKKMVELMGITQILHPDFEADDLAGLLVASRPGRTRLVTGDSDWLQLIRDDVEWYDPREGGKLVTLETLHQHYGYFTPSEYLEGKTLMGDDTDSIPGIPDIGKKTAIEFIARWKSVPEFFAAVDSGKYTPQARKSKTAKTLHPEQVLASPEGRATYFRNMALMDLRSPRIPNPEAIEITKAPLDATKLETLCARLGFASITRNFAEWVRPFQA